MQDFIGDIHGHASELKNLLKKLGYELKGGVYKHAERTAFFLGDFIDKGPDSPGVVNIVRAMVEAGYAKAIMGNHEYNAILYNTQVSDNYLRKHSGKNKKQHGETLEQYANKPAEYQQMIDWFKTLPLFYETDFFRAVHACWHKPSLNVLAQALPNGILSEEHIKQSANRNSALHKALEIGLKGLETHLPNNISFKDNYGHKRQAMRIKWWLDPTNKSIKEMSVLDNIELPSHPFEKAFENYATQDKPVFFGHYWLQGKPTLQKHNVCCLDYSVAKGGSLCAYRYHGEMKLDASNIVYV